MADQGGAPNQDAGRGNGQDEVALTDGQKHALPLTKFVDFLLGGTNSWNMACLTSSSLAATGRTRLFQICNFSIVFLASCWALPTAHHVGDSQAKFRVVRFLAIAYLEYATFLLCFEVHRIGGASWTTVGPILASLLTLFPLIWSIAISPQWWQSRIHARHLGQHFE